MASDVYTFEKTLNERLTELQTILCVGKESLPAHKVRSVWGNYLELTVEPCGWNAIWKLCRRSCEKYGISFPTVVFAVVLRVYCAELSALIEVAAIQDDIQLPTYHKVPLAHLYPTKQQRKEWLRIEETAECLDQLRFFYNHIWWPWDDFKESSKSDWPTIHLPLRIELLEAMQLDGTCYEKWEYLKCILQEAKDIKQNIDFLESEVTEDREPPAENTYLLTKYHLRMNQIKKEVQVFESPLTRKLLVQQKIRERYGGIEANNKSTWIIFQGQSVEDLRRLIIEAEKYLLPATVINSCSTVQHAFESSFENKFILLFPGQHKINNLEIQRSCIIRGFVENPLSSSVVADGSFILACQGGTFVLEDLIITCEKNAPVIIVRSGILQVRNCHFKGTNRSFNSPSIILLQGAHAEIQNCTISNLGTGLIICPGAVAHVASSEISSCHVGIQMSEDAILVTDDLRIIKSTECALKVECINEENYQKRTGTTNIVSSFCGIKNNNLAIESTVGDEVVIIHNDNLLPYEDVCA